MWLDPDSVLQLLWRQQRSFPNQTLPTVLFLFRNTPGYLRAAVRRHPLVITARQNRPKHPRTIRSLATSIIARQMAPTAMRFSNLTDPMAFIQIREQSAAAKPPNPPRFPRIVHPLAISAPWQKPSRPNIERCLVPSAVPWLLKKTRKKTGGGRQ